jgi:N-acetylglucosaminyldiphosphoundecaprenol N-acetyl-beta-D-mannosaminyltransferase
VKPDIVIVGMGAIAQERFLLGLKQAGFSGKGFTCGGFIHQTASNKIDYYPRWVDKLNLRFLYRMLKESYTRQRYAKAAFLFPVRFLAEKFE